MRVLFLLFIFIVFSYSKALQSVSIQLNWKYQFQFAGYIMAKEKGFYKNIGLDVNLKEFDGQGKLSSKLLEDYSEFKIVRPTSLIDIANGADLVFLATIFQTSPFALVTHKGLNIDSFSDIKGKTIMVSDDFLYDTSMLAMLFSNGLKIDDFKTKAPTKTRIDDLIEGKIDLLGSYISYEPYILQERGLEPVIFTSKDLGFDFYSDILATNKDFLKNNQKLVDDFLKATLKGWEYAFSNMNETVEIIFNKYNTQHKSKSSLEYEANELKKLAFYGTNELGKIELLKLEKIYNSYKILGIADKNLDFESIVYNSQLSKQLKLSQKERDYLFLKGGGRSLYLC